MPSLYQCLQTAIEAGELDRARGKMAQRQFQQLADNYASSMPREAAEALAGIDMKTALGRAATTRRHAVLAQLQTMRRNEQRYGGSDVKPQKIVDDMEDVGKMQDAYTRQFMGSVGNFLQTHSKNLVGNVRERALLLDVVRELHGEATGSASAKLMAKAIRDAQNRARALFNAHGGDIGELADRGLRHAHSRQKITKAGFKSWRDEISTKLDWNRIIDHQTGKPFTSEVGGRPNRAAADRFLKAVYDDITTAGWKDRSPSMATGGKALYNTRAEARVLHFNDADDWMSYNDLFGDANPFDAIVDELSGLARDIALMKTFGPNPKAGLEHASQVMQRNAALSLDPKNIELIDKKTKLARVMLGDITGENNVPANHAMAAFFAGTREVIVSSKLGSATISALSDWVTMRSAAKAIGMNPNNLFKREMDLMASNATKETAARMGYVADTLSQTNAASIRFMGDIWSPQITKRISSFALRVNGLSFVTDMRRIAFKMEFAGHLADNAGRRLNDMDPELQKIFRESGFTEADWDLLRDANALFTADNGATFLSPSYWLEHTNAPRAQAEDLAIRLETLSEEWMEFAIPSTSLEGKAFLKGTAAPGSVGGEIMRSSIMFKSYAISLQLNQYRHVMAMPTGLARAQYVASISAQMIIMGAMAVQLKEIVKGRDPLPMDNPKFWAAALMQGGGVGIFGDFFASETSRAGGGFAETLAGPVVGLGGDILRVVASNVASIAAGDGTNFGRDFVNLARYNAPLTTNWYTRLVTDRLVWDQVQDFLDPEARSQWRRSERKRAREYGNTSWWDRGELLPNRAPDISNAAGELFQ